MPSTYVATTSIRGHEVYILDDLSLQNVVALQDILIIRCNAQQMKWERAREVARVVQYLRQLECLNQPDEGDCFD